MTKQIAIAGLCCGLLTVTASGADLDIGKTLALKGNTRGATACQTCHAADGSGNAAAGFPRLSGINAEYLAKQLYDFQHGRRTDPVMQPIAKALSDTEITDVVAYFAAQTSVTAPINKDTVLIARGARLALNGLWDHDIPSCVSCHGPAGQGVGRHFPALAGQHAVYITKQMEAWRSGTRRNDPLDLMKGIAQRMPADDIAAVSAYFASLAPVK
ncbi:MAG: cytochrome c4 [Gammaproteobacteria bacterium]|nr:cytochrome c4 [Gammaproteobacteria bacterium]